jgi:putative FmdB family regulatory protein
VPIYTYSHNDPAVKTCPVEFEYSQSVKEEPLSLCPWCGKPVRRLISLTAPYRKNILTNSNLKEKGFVRLERKEYGVYEKTTR